MRSTVCDIARKFLFAFTFTIPFSNAFGLHKWLPIPMFVLLVEATCITAIFLNLGHLKYERKCFSSGDLWLVLFLIWMFLSVALNGEVVQKNLNHLSALVTVIFVYFFFVKFLLALSYTLPNRQSYHFKFLCYPLLVTSVFVCLEFIDSNFVDLGIRRVLVYAEDIKEYAPLYAGTFYRARGFTSESGNLALFLNTFFPLVLTYFLNRRKYAYLFLFFALYVSALAFSFSAAGFFFVLCAITVSLLVYLYDHRTGRVSARGLTLILLICLFFLASLTVIPKRYLLPIKDKLLLSQTSGAQDRVNRWVEAISSIKQHPIIGTGIGTTVTKYGTGVVSLYLLLLREGGVLAFLLFMTFVTNIFYKILKMPKEFSYKYAYIISFVAVLGQYTVISDFWLPWIWFLFSIIACDLALLNRAKPIKQRIGRLPSSLAGMNIS